MSMTYDTQSASSITAFNSVILRNKFPHPGLSSHYNCNGIWTKASAAKAPPTKALAIKKRPNPRQQKPGY